MLSNTRNRECLARSIQVSASLRIRDKPIQNLHEAYQGKYVTEWSMREMKRENARSRLRFNRQHLFGGLRC
jgi:hypothetical protein